MVESWSSLWPDAEPLMQQHHLDVVGLDPREPFDPDIEGIEASDAAGTLLITSARFDGQLAGYCIWYIARNVESKGLWIGIAGPWYVVAEHRAGGLGIRLFKFSLTELRSRGIAQAYPHHWFSGGGERLGDLYERLGAKRCEVTFKLWL